MFLTIKQTIAQIKHLLQPQSKLNPNDYFTLSPVLPVAVPVI
jgi:hypothetical protein